MTKGFYAKITPDVKYDVEWTFAHTATRKQDEVLKSFDRLDVVSDRQTHI